MKIKMKKLILIAAVAVVVLGPGALVRRNSWIFSRNMRELSSITEEKIIYLSELTPFTWDSVYSFGPYVSKEEMESVLGFASSSLKEGISEDMMTVFFVRGQKVVCRVVGYPHVLGYRLDLNYWWDSERNYMRIDQGLDEFTLLQDKDIVHLKFEGKTFTGTIKELYGSTAMVAIDDGQDIRRSGDQVLIRLNEEQQAVAKTGDRVRVAYDGLVQETAPLQIPGQMETELLQN